MSITTRQFIISIACSFFWWMHATAQVPGVKWNFHYTNRGPTGNLAFYDVKPTRDKGFIVVGSDSSFTSVGYRDTVLNKHPLGTAWIEKIDSNGNREWATANGIDQVAVFTSVQQTTDGGYIAVGSRIKTTVPTDVGALLVRKFSATGSLVWEKLLGGTAKERAYAVIQSADGNYVIAGITGSNNGQVSGNHGGDDAWLVKINTTGTILWQKCFGGTLADTAHALVQTPDQGFVIAGSSASSNGNLTGNKGSVDGWLFKTDSLGNILWQKNFGGSSYDIFRGVALSPDGGIITAGYTRSALSGDILSNHGIIDTWVVKTSGSGTLQWSKCFGGSNNDFALGIQRTNVNQFLLAGFTESTDGDVSGQNGGADMWLVLLDNSGALVWQKCAGGAAADYGTAAFALPDNRFIIAGSERELGNRQFGDYDGALVLLGNTNTIKGNVFLDANLNGVKDNGENYFDQLQINANNNGTIKSARPYQGRFSINTDIGSTTTTFALSNPYYTTVPASKVSVFASYFNTDSFDIAVQPIPGKKDLAVSLLPLTGARPGFDVTYKLLYRNKGTTDIPSGSITFIKDPRSTVTSTSATPVLMNADTLQWNYSNLLANDSAIITITLKLDNPPSINIGDTLHFTGIIDPVTADETPADDTARVKQLVTGSFDPNDKTETNAGVISKKQLADGEYLTYLVRFQNTGTDTAFAVTIKDTLESKLDWNTLEMLGSSHPYQLSVNNGNQLTWQFDDIKLVDSVRNEPASHGYVAFRIRPLSTLIEGDIVNNTASVYFDYNLPVQTNIQRTTITTSAALPIRLARWNAALNNDKVVLSWQTSYEYNVAYFEVQFSTDGIKFDGIGNMTAQNNPAGYSYSLQHAGFIKGNNYYRLITHDADGTSRISNTLLIYAGNNRAFISTVYPNPASGAVTVHLQGDLKGTAFINILNVSGKKLSGITVPNLATGSFSTVINLGNLVKGVYVIECRINEYIKRQKLIVQ